MSKEAEQSTPSPKQRRKLGVTATVLLSLALGVAAGLFFGEYVAWMKLIGDVYVGLLQMTVLPYIMVALIGSLGSLTWGEGRKLVVRGAVVLLVLWALGLAVVMLAPLALPDWQSTSFFRPDSLDPKPGVNFLELFVPSNVFGSLAGNIVPAVVVFCLAVGAALIGMEKKKGFLDLLATVQDALMRVNSSIVKLTPIGVFAIAAGTASTMTIQEFGRLQGYLVIYTVAVLYLGLLVLPLGIAAVTPFTYRRILRASKDAMAMAFATGKVLVVLPMLIENTKAMFAELAARPREAESLDSGHRREAARDIDVMYPLAYPFPSLGKVLSLIFVPFVGWFVGDLMGVADYPAFLVAGLFSMFGGPIASIPFLLEMQQLPADMFQLFMAAGVWTARVGDLLSAMHLVAMAVLTTASVAGILRIHWGSFLRFLVITGVVGILGIVCVRAVLGRLASSTETGAEILAGMTLHADAYGFRAKSVVFVEEPEPNPQPLREGQTVLERIRERDTLRVGVAPDRAPWSYRNASGELVGFEVDMAHRLAADLGVGLEFVFLDYRDAGRAVDRDLVDLVMSGLPGTVQLAEEARLSKPYLSLTLAFLVPDYLVRDFRTMAQIRQMPQLRVGVPVRSEYTQLLPRIFPGATVADVPEPRAFLEGRLPDVDALLVSAETGSVWTLTYPRFRIVVPEGSHTSIPAVYVLPRHDDEFREFLDHWIDLRQHNRLIDVLRNQWILGKVDEKKEPRWSVIRNVLGWVD